MTETSNNLSLLRELAVLEGLMQQRGLAPPVAPPIKKARTLPVDADTLDPYTWTMRYRRIEGQSFSFANHRPMEAIYRDNHPDITIMKCAQVGASEWAISRTLHALDVGAQFWRTGKKGLNIAYLFPTGKALSDFSKERITGAMDEHPHIRSIFTGFDDITFKEAGESYLYLRSTWIGGRGKNRAGENLLSFPADMIVMDEYDRMNSAAVALVEKRLRASVVKRQLKLSTPTLPGHGIHEAYLDTDQRVWEVSCACGEWVEMNFFEHVHAQREGRDDHPLPQSDWQDWDREQMEQAVWTVRCPHCGGVLDRTGGGRWSARRPEIRSRRGYHLPALAFAAVRLLDLALASVSADPSRLEEFYRSDLGIPYQAAGSNVTDALLDSAPALAPWMRPPYHEVTMGVDVGARFHYRISGLIGGEAGGDGVMRPAVRVVLRMGTVSTWADLSHLINQWGVTRCVIDALPELHGTKTWADGDTHPACLVYRAFYATERGQQAELFKVNDEERTISINRTMAMDAVYAELVRRAEVWPKALLTNRDIRAHLKAPVRVIVTDDSGQSRAMWSHTGPDHFYHATLYDTMGGLMTPPPLQTWGVVVQAVGSGWTPPTAGMQPERTGRRRR